MGIHKIRPRSKNLTQVEKLTQDEKSDPGRNVKSAIEHYIHFFKDFPGPSFERSVWPGWPDEFVKKITQKIYLYTFYVKINT
jgi:hypothetical protein